MVRLGLILSLTVLVSACVSPYRPSAFIDPGALVGQQVRLCGYVGSGHLRRSRTNYGEFAYFLLLDHNGDFHRTTGTRTDCFEGVLEPSPYAPPPEAVCIDWCAHYALRLNASE